MDMVMNIEVSGKNKDWIKITIGLFVIYEGVSPDDLNKVIASYVNYGYEVFVEEK